MMFSRPPLQSVSADFLTRHKVRAAILRLDKIHAVISGNKWYKLKYYLQEAAALNAGTVATFGGAYSNHIVATACAARLSGFNSFGVIRGEMPEKLSHTLSNAIEYGMKLHFVSREDYRDKAAIKKSFKDYYWIDEGGFGEAAAKGAGEILDNANLDDYTYIIVAAGTGATFAGVIKKILPHQKAIGISVMKNNSALTDQIKSLLTKEEQQKNFDLLHDFHFGGYAKKNNELIDFMNETFVNTGVPLDFVYTGKAFYAMKILIEKEAIPANSKVLFIHTGGLQGNLSLQEGLLKF